MPRKSSLLPPGAPNTAAAAPSQGVVAVDRALLLLRRFDADHPALSLTELAARTHQYKSTVLRLLASLQQAGFVQRDADGRYRPGPEVARLHRVYAASFTLDQVVLPVLQELVRRTGESAAYHVRQGDARLCLFRVDSPHPVRDHIQAGDVLPLAQGTGGRVLTAFDTTLRRSGSQKDRLLLAKIREQGYFAAIGDRMAEVAGISAPVFAADGRLAAALTLTMPAHRYDKGYIRHVLELARQLGAAL
jgi:DNA-binding IclR family transcriptional regulator